MSGVSVTHLVLFIASMVVASSVAVAFTGQVDDLTASLDQRGDDLSDEVRTDVEVISDAGSQVYNQSGSQNVTLLVKNTGSRTLASDDTAVDAVVDGTYVGNVSVTVLDGTTWDEAGVARVEIDGPTLDTGDHRVKVVVSGDEEVFRFNT